MPLETRKLQTIVDGVRNLLGVCLGLIAAGLAEPTCFLGGATHRQSVR